MSLDASFIVTVNVTRETAALTRTGFGVPLVLGEHSVFAERIRFFSDLTEVSAAGFTSSDPEFVMATRLFGQELTPTQIAIGRRTTPVAQVNNVTVDTVTDSINYIITINGTVFSHPSGIGATAASISAGLDILINAGTEPVTSLDNTGDLDLTSDDAGRPFTLSVSAEMSFTTTTPHNGIDLDIQAVEDENPGWYKLLATSHLRSDVEVASADIEARKKIYITSSDDTDIVNVAETSATDIAKFLKDKSLLRSSVIFSADAGEFPEAAWAGTMCPRLPGSATWAFKTLAGITVDDLTTTQTGNADDKNANYYVDIQSFTDTFPGKMANGEFIDLTRGIDEFSTRIAENIFRLLSIKPKVPYTSQGIALVEAEIRKEIQRGLRNGVIAPGELNETTGLIEDEPIVTVPAIADTDVNDRAARILRDVKFQWRAAGAIHTVIVDGTVTV